MLKQIILKTNLKLALILKIFKIHSLTYYFKDKKVSFFIQFLVKVY